MAGDGSITYLWTVICDCWPKQALYKLETAFCFQSSDIFSRRYDYGTVMLLYMKMFLAFSETLDGKRILPRQASRI